MRGCSDYSQNIVLFRKQLQLDKLTGPSTFVFGVIRVNHTNVIHYQERCLNQIKELSSPRLMDQNNALISCVHEHQDYECGSATAGPSSWGDPGGVKTDTDDHGSDLFQTRQIKVIILVVILRMRWFVRRKHWNLIKNSK